MPTESFDTVGEHTWTAPSDTTVTLTLNGAGGGAGGKYRPSLTYHGDGGNGGYLEAEYSVSADEQLTVYVGGQGSVGEVTSGGSGGDGYNPGGNGGDGETFQNGGGGGGGGSTVVIDSNQNVIAAAGGGGGGAGNTYAGEAGGGGGGGAGGGSGGVGPNDAGYGQSAVTGTGTGGDGGDGSTTVEDEEDGFPGRTSTPNSTAITQIDGGGSSGNGSVTIEYTAPPAAPNNVSASYVADDQLDLAFDADTSSGPINNYEVEIDRDGNGWMDPAGGPSAPSSAGTYSYGPASDTAYGRQVGIDSAFQFRVRASGDGRTSSWVTTGTVYTSPVPPHKPSVSRPDPNTFDISWTNKTDDLWYVKIKVREDSGSGYGGWDNFKNVTSGSSTTISVGDSSDYDSLTIEEDARYQFKLQNANNGDRRSEWVYADYGNGGNVYFEDDFESGDLSAWDSTFISGDSGVYDSSFVDGNAYSDDQSSNSRAHPVTGPDEGTYYLFGDGDGYVQKNLGDLSNESGVIVKCAMAAGSMDDASKAGGLRWYDGSSWNDLRQFSHQYNRQEWVEVTALVPQSWISTDNRLRLESIGGSGDYMAWDRVVVSDILHEYTTPAKPSNLSLDASTEGEITASWTRNASFGGWEDTDYRPVGASSWNGPWSPDTIETFTGLSDGEQYEVRLRAVVRQSRRGSTSDYWYSAWLTPQTAVTVLPAPTNLTTSTTNG